LQNYPRTVLTKTRGHGFVSATEKTPVCAGAFDFDDRGDQ
jgi:hypothetical protein